MTDAHEGYDEPVREEDIPRPKVVGPSQSGDQVDVFSGLHMPLGGTIWTELKNGEVDGREWQLMPGDNFLARDLWDDVKALPGIVARMDHGAIKPGYTSKLHDAEMLLAPAPRSYIRSLSAKATRIGDDQLFGGKRGSQGASPEARLRALEAKIRQLKG